MMPVSDLAGAFRRAKPTRPPEPEPAMAAEAAVEPHHPDPTGDAEAEAAGQPRLPRRREAADPAWPTA